MRIKCNKRKLQVKQTTSSLNGLIYDSNILIKRNYVFFSMLIFLVTSCGLTRGYKEHPVVQTETATGYKMKQYGNLYIGGQPSALDFIKLRQEGFATIINLREHKEDGKYHEKWERNNSLLSGMSYFHAGFDPQKDQLDEVFINKINDVVSSQIVKGKVLIHCSSGDRAAMWLVANENLNGKLPKDKAIKLAHTIEVKKEAWNQLILFLK